MISPEGELRRPVSRISIQPAAGHAGLLLVLAAALGSDASHGRLANEDKKRDEQDACDQCHHAGAELGESNRKLMFDQLKEPLPDSGDGQDHHRDEGDQEVARVEKDQPRQSIPSLGHKIKWGCRVRDGYLNLFRSRQANYIILMLICQVCYNSIRYESV